MQLVRADTAIKVVIGPVVDYSDGYTMITSLTMANADAAYIIKHDATAGTTITGNTFTGVTSVDGYYNLTLTAGQLDTEGLTSVIIRRDTSILPVRHDFMVVNANVYDSLYAAAATDYLDVNAHQLGGTAQTGHDVGQIGADWADGGRLDLLLDQVISDIAALNDISAADVNTQMLDVLNTDTFGEPAQGAPAATTTLVNKIGFLYKFMRNKIETTTAETKVYDDAGTTVDHKASISDDGTTFTRGEFATGP
jgi:hypothetical protein